MIGRISSRSLDLLRTTDSLGSWKTGVPFYGTPIINNSAGSRASLFSRKYVWRSQLQRRLAWLPELFAMILFLEFSECQTTVKVSNILFCTVSFSLWSYKWCLFCRKIRQLWSALVDISSYYNTGFNQREKVPFRSVGIQCCYGLKSQRPN